MLDPSLSRLAVLAVCALIASLSYLPQYFLFLDLPRSTSYRFNGLILCIWISYYRSIASDPGSVPSSWEPSDADNRSLDAEEARGRGERRRLVASHGRWCRKCSAWKPPRAHHCKTCRKCVVKMDHHCPWTNNCVGYANLPDFLRFLGSAVAATWWCFGLMAAEAWMIWGEREMPAYLGRYSSTQLVLLFLLLPTAFFTAFFLTILLGRTLYQVAQNYTTIETWEESKHEDAVRRSRRSHMDSIRRPLKKQVFPYDIGIWENLCCAFGYSANIASWLWVFSRAPRVGAVVQTTVGEGEKIKAGLEWEVNGFEDPGTVWPPIDPEKEMFQNPPPGEELRVREQARATTLDATTGVDGQMDVNAFRRRQQRDLEMKRWKRPTPTARLANPPGSRYPTEEEARMQEREEANRRRGVGQKEVGQKEVWRNEDGETLADYGVDEDEDEDLPLAVLMRRRKRMGDPVADLAATFL